MSGKFNRVDPRRVFDEDEIEASYWDASTLLTRAKI